jgi:hypothetical protein
LLSSCYMIQGNTLQTQDLPSASLFRCTPSLGATADMGVGLWRCKSLSPGSTFGLTGVNSRQRLSPKHPMKKGPSANEARNPKSEREHSGSLAFGHSIFGFRRLLGSLRVWVFGYLGIWVFRHSALPDNAGPGLFRDLPLSRSPLIRVPQRRMAEPWMSAQGRRARP